MAVFGCRGAQGAFSLLYQGLYIVYDEELLTFETVTALHVRAHSVYRGCVCVCVYKAVSFPAKPTLRPSSS